MRAPEHACNVFRIRIVRWDFAIRSPTNARDAIRARIAQRRYQSVIWTSTCASSARAADNAPQGRSALSSRTVARPHVGRTTIAPGAGARLARLRRGFAWNVRWTPIVWRSAVHRGATSSSEAVLNVSWVPTAPPDGASSSSIYASNVSRPPTAAATCAVITSAHPDEVFGAPNVVLGISSIIGRQSDARQDGTDEDGHVPPCEGSSTNIWRSVRPRSSTDAERLPTHGGTLNHREVLIHQVLPVVVSLSALMAIACSESSSAASSDDEPGEPCPQES
jgi:hypothetical protein